MFPILLLQAFQTGSPASTSASTGTASPDLNPPKDDQPRIDVLCAIIIGAGLLGGYLNYLRTRTTPPLHPPADYAPPATAESGYWRLCVVGGIVAAALVPLFLQTIQSSLLSRDISPIGYFIFAGLCLLAAVFSNSFLDNLAQQVFNAKQQAAAADQKATRAQAATNAVVSASTDVDEPAAGTDGHGAQRFSTSERIVDSVRTDASLSPAAGQVLQRLREGHSPFYSVEALARRTGTDATTAQQALTELADRGYVVAVPNGSALVYGLTRNRPAD